MCKSAASKKRQKPTKKRTRSDCIVFIKLDLEVHSGPAFKGARNQWVHSTRQSRQGRTEQIIPQQHIQSHFRARNLDSRRRRCASTTISGDEHFHRLHVPHTISCWHGRPHRGLTGYTVSPSHTIIIARSPEPISKRPQKDRLPATAEAREGQHTAPDETRRDNMECDV